MEAVNTAPIGVRARPAWQIWLSWVLYTALGFFISAALGAALTLSVSWGMLLSPVMLVISWLVVGFLQWVVLRREIPGFGWPGWLLATALGQLVGSVLAIVGVIGPVLFGALEDLPETIPASATRLAIQVVGGLVLGLALGVAQWLVLRGYIAGAGWWVPASMLAGAISTAVPSLQSLGLSGVAAVILTKVVAGALAAAITGAVLAWLLRKPWKTSRPVLTPEQA